MAKLGETYAIRQYIHILFTHFGIIESGKNVNTTTEDEEGCHGHFGRRDPFQDRYPCDGWSTVLWLSDLNSGRSFNPDDVRKDYRKTIETDFKIS